MDVSLFSRRGGEVCSSRQQEQLCLLDGYSLALEVPKATSAKRVGLKRDTEEASVLLFFPPSSSIYCIVSGVLLENGTLPSSAVSLFCFRKDCGPEGRQGTDSKGEQVG